jgi:hypothetical protein
MSILAPLTLAAATGAMAATPLVPAWLEFKHRRDAAPLPTRADNGHIENFADAFAARFQPLSARIADCAIRRDTRVVSLNDGFRALLVGDVIQFGEIRAMLERNQISAIALCAAGVELDDEHELHADAYCAGDLETGSECRFRALYCRGNARLGPRNRVLRWIHAEGELGVGERGELYGRASSRTGITLSQACRFERVHAPVVRIGIEEVPLDLQQPSEYPGRSIMDLRLGRVLASGDFRLDCGDVLQGHVIAAGSVWVHAGSRILGSVKSHHDGHIEKGSDIHGALISSSNLHIEGGSHIHGPVVAETELTIGAHTQIGNPDAPTSVSAPRIRIAPGCVVYGTLWARGEGVVKTEGAEV